MKAGHLLAALLLITLSNVSVTTTTGPGGDSGTTTWSLTPLSIAIGIAGCLALLTLFRPALVTPAGRALARQRIAALLTRGPAAWFPCAWCYLLLIFPVFGIGFGIVRESGSQTQHHTIAFGPVASVWPLVLAATGLTLFNLALALIQPPSPAPQPGAAT